MEKAFAPENGEQMGQAGRVARLGRMARELEDLAQTVRGQVEALRVAARERKSGWKALVKGTEVPEDLDALGEAASQLTDLAQDLQRASLELQEEFLRQSREHERFTALYDISRVLNSTLDLDELLELVMDIVIRTTRAERGFLMLRDRETGQLRFRVARNMSQETIAGPSFEISRSVVERVADHGEVVLTTNAQEDPRFSSQASVVGYALRSILCVPLRLREEITGVIYVDNRLKAGLFSPGDREFLSAFANQAAVAIENARLFGEQRKALEQITRMKDLLDNVLASIASGVITLDKAGRVTLVNRAAEQILGLSARDVLGRPYTVLGQRLEETGFPLLLEQVQSGKRRHVLGELEVQSATRGVLWLRLQLSPLGAGPDRRNGGGVAVVLEDLTERRRLEEAQARERQARERIQQTFARYVAPRVVDRLVQGEADVRLGGVRQEVSVLFADIRGFSALGQKLGPEALVDLLNQYLTLAGEAVLDEEGTLDKFTGDGLMALFNVPLPQTDHPLRAARAALRLRERVARYVQGLAEPLRLQFGVGIDVGEAVVGNIGMPRLMDYTAVGDCVNLAKRLQELAAPGQVLLSRRAYLRLGDAAEVRPLDPVLLKGRQAPEPVYELLALRADA
ncbi:MAG: GAF domain-containing protein [Anaerolineae bacterium]|nr:GAF domain-containing protein [Anaerolineae bacterium]